MISGLVARPIAGAAIKPVPRFSWAVSLYRYLRPDLTPLGILSVQAKWRPVPFQRHLAVARLILGPVSVTSIACLAARAAAALAATGWPAASVRRNRTVMVRADAAISLPGRSLMKPPKP